VLCRIHDALSRLSLSRPRPLRRCLLPAAPYQRDLLVLDVLLRRLASALPLPIALRAILPDLVSLPFLSSVLGQHAHPLVVLYVILVPVLYVLSNNITLISSAD
jgi:hypothetical protein